MLTRKDVAEASDVLTEMAAATAQDLAEGDVAGEEDFSGQLIGRCKEKLHNRRTATARWRVGATVTEAGAVRPSLPFAFQPGKPDPKVAITKNRRRELTCLWFFTS